MLLTALIFIGVLFVLILVHEWGHYITAKKTGMRVDEFGIGFPPKVWSTRRGETEYSLNALPIGGFVRIYGEDPTKIENEADRERSFSARPRWAQAIVLIAGVVMNVLLAWVLLIAVFLTNGPIFNQDTIGTPTTEVRVGSVLENGPASGVLPVDAQIIAIASAGEVLDDLSPDSISSFIADAGSETLFFTYAVSNQENTVEISPQQGLLDTDPDRYAIGIGFDVRTSYTVMGAITGATMYAWDMLVLIVVSIVGLFVDTATGEGDMSDVAGPIGIFNLVGQVASVGIAPLLEFTAIISLNLAIINLFPIPALDGGRLVFVAIESIIRRPLDPVWTSRLNLVGFILLLGLMVAVTFNDILRLIGG